MSQGSVAVRKISFDVFPTLFPSSFLLYTLLFVEVLAGSSSFIVSLLTSA